MSLRFRSNFPTFKKKVLLFRAVFILIALNFFIIESVIARHKCPKVPAPPGVMGIISSTTLIPSGSTMAAARSSETSGCERGHPSKNFYKPKYKTNLLISFIMKKKIGNAVKRNKIRRKLKAIVHKLLKKRGAINRDYTYIVFGKSNAYTEKQSVLMPAMIKCFKKLSK